MNKKINFSKYFNTITNNYLAISKWFVFIVFVFLIVFIFPKTSKFKYDYQQSKPWAYDDLIAPFDFAILKTNAEIETEKYELIKNHKPYFVKKKGIENTVKQNVETEFKKQNLEKDININNLNKIIDSVYQKGIIRLPIGLNKNELTEVYLINENIANMKLSNDFYTINEAKDFIDSYQLTHIENPNFVKNIIVNNLIQNIEFDSTATNNSINTAINNMSIAQGMVQNGERIISKGELITKDKYIILESLKKAFEKQVSGTNYNFYAIFLGQFILVFTIMLMFYIYLYYYYKAVFFDNKKVSFILIITYLMILITNTVVKYDMGYMYIVPVLFVPILVKSFFDSQLGLIVHVVMLTIIGLLIPNSFQFVFLQLVSGVIVVVSLLDFKHRASFFITVILIFLTYSTIYLGLSLINSGSIKDIDYYNFILLAISASILLFTQPFIFISEKLFGFVTDLSLMELTDTNNKLLREYATKAPGSFHHSIQVADLAEEAIYHIGGNQLLVRAGALYHDIGKMFMPLYFIENKVMGIDPHKDLSSMESAKLIISHVAKGIEIAKQHNIPDIVIDFIRTHHGTSLTRFFYASHIEEYDEISEDIESEFRYTGPIPYSKETAVLMMVDSLEAATRSMKKHDADNIGKLVDDIINKQIEEKQFENADITLKEMNIVKKIIKKNLINIYHPRIEYPS